ncbi:MAG: hypothetical protein MSA33_02445 [Campylobacter sp.]|nr:hypothetical protein [Campylobacter sp.]
MLEIRFNAIFALYLYFIGCFALRGCRLAQLFASHPLGMRFLLLKPCAAQRLTQKLLLAFVR